MIDNNPQGKLVREKMKLKSNWIETQPTNRLLSNLPHNFVVQFGYHHPEENICVGITSSV